MMNIMKYIITILIFEGNKESKKVGKKFIDKIVIEYAIIWITPKTKVAVTIM